MPWPLSSVSSSSASWSGRDMSENAFQERISQYAGTNVPLTMVGDNDIMLPVAVNGGLIKRVWLHHTGNVTKAELRTNGTPRIRAELTGRHPVHA